jgi:hypothetical protein
VTIVIRRHRVVDRFAASRTRLAACPARRSASAADVGRDRAAVARTSPSFAAGTGVLRSYRRLVRTSLRMSLALACDVRSLPGVGRSRQGPSPDRSFNIRPRTEMEHAGCSSQRRDQSIDRDHQHSLFEALDATCADHPDEPARRLHRTHGRRRSDSYAAW